MDTTAHHHIADIETTLAFLNSESFDDGLPVEHLASADAAIAFLVERDLGHEGALRDQARRVGEAAWLERVRATRAALRGLWDAQVEECRPDAADVDAVNAVLREAPRIELVAGDGCCGIGHRHADDDPTGEALARLVGPFVDAVASGTTVRFRICANDGCRWVFEDTSRGGRRRWCDMSSCGNVAKVRRYRAKHREAADGDAGPEAIPA